MSRVFSKAVIAGGTGFLGQALAKSFISEGVEVVVLTRNLVQKSSLYGRLVKWDAKTLDSWSSELDRADLLINLTGRSIDCRHTKRNKDLILSSRIDSTKILGEACSALNDPPKVWMNASTATIYEDIRGDVQPHDEFSDPFAKGFSEDVGREWEEVFFNHNCDGIRKIALRISIVLGNNGGAFPVLRNFTKIGLGGKQGSGNQWISWLHIDDWVGIVWFLMSKNKIFGPVNLATPNPVTNSSFMLVMRRFFAPLGIGLPSPIWAVRFGTFFMRTAPDLVLKSRKLVSKVLLDFGYNFKHANIKSAIKQLY
jgi:uncharacterized protein (TIGR01777 family)